MDKVILKMLEGSALVHICVVLSLWDILMSRRRRITQREAKLSVVAG
jgi:hypothetical protein